MTKKADLSKELEPLKSKLHDVATAAKEQDQALHKQLKAVASSVKNLDGLKDQLNNVASAKAVESVKTAVDGAAKAPAKTQAMVKENQQYLKQIYKDLQKKVMRGRNAALEGMETH